MCHRAPEFLRYQACLGQSLHISLLQAGSMPRLSHSRNRAEAKALLADEVAGDPRLPNEDHAVCNMTIISLGPRLSARIRPEKP